MSDKPITEEHKKLWREYLENRAIFELHHELIEVGEDTYWNQIYPLEKQYHDLKDLLYSALTLAAVSVPNLASECQGSDHDESI